MKYGKHWSISNEKKQEYVNKLLPHLSALRAKAGLSQEELSCLVGVSRQTYCLTESCSRGMSWNTYLSIIMFFDYNLKTHDFIHTMGIFPDELFYHFNPESSAAENARTFDNIPEMNAMFETLDNHGKNTVRLAISSEYARCNGLDKNTTMKIIGDVLK